MKTAIHAFMLFELSVLLGCGKSEDVAFSPVSQEQRDVASLSGEAEKPSSGVRKVLPLDDDLAVAIAGATKRIRLGMTWAWPPEHADKQRFSDFTQSNKSRWILELKLSKIPSGTMYEQSTSTEEGGIVHEYLLFAGEQTTWWFDGRGDDFSEFKNPPVRKQKVSELFLAIHDGQSGWKPVSDKKAMPLDQGLAIGIELEDGSQRYW